MFRRRRFIFPYSKRRLLAKSNPPYNKTPLITHDKRRFSWFTQKSLKSKPTHRTSPPFNPKQTSSITAFPISARKCDAQA